MWKIFPLDFWWQKNRNWVNFMSRCNRSSASTWTRTSPLAYLEISLSFLELILGLEKLELLTKVWATNVHPPKKRVGNIAWCKKHAALTEHFYCSFPLTINPTHKDITYLFSLCICKVPNGVCILLNIETFLWRRCCYVEGCFLMLRRVHYTECPPNPSSFPRLFIRLSCGGKKP